MGVKELAKVDDNKGELIAPTPPKIDLRHTKAIRRELASVYRDMRSGRILTADGTKLAYVLDMLRKSYETALLEERIIEIEIMLENRK